MKSWHERRSKEVRTNSNDHRSDFQIDKARIIHSATFRRLQTKTQVLGLGESDFYRTRLTHSIEVSQIGVSILRQILFDLVQNKKSEFTLVSDILPEESLIEAICLAHDIGHPPFGHGGEVALQSVMFKSGGFEGNAQTLRILSRLEKYKEGFGMDMSRRTLLGILKYPVSFKETTKADSFKGYQENPDYFKKDEYKPPKCFYDEDQEIVDWIMKMFSREDAKKFRSAKDVKGKRFKKSQYKSFDCSIMDKSDEISYAVHDLEDGVALRIIDEKCWDTLIGPALKMINDRAITSFFKAIRDDLFADSFMRKRAISKLVGFFIKRIELKEIKGFKDKLLKYNVVLDENAEILLRALGKITFENMVQRTQVQRLEFKGQNIVVALFRMLKSDPERLLEKETLEKYNKAKNKDRVICDYISGMTDFHAVKTFNTLVSPDKGSIFEKI